MPRQGCEKKKGILICESILMCVLLLGQYNTKYYYEVGHRNTTRQFSFITPPQIGPDVPYTFGLIGKCVIGWLDIVTFFLTRFTYILI